ncbi:MAG TPA: DUF4097 family beta strand repeat-containing protein [Bryobacteraceae bacterium]|jgi:hypothetical protein|nr:DUF4097 family beta strand repeat-containing protein [Bryobacteraceae bacterium]
MKRHFTLTTLALAGCALSAAQEGRVVVAPRDASRPWVVNIATVNSGITVRTYDGKDVIVESEERSRRRPLPDTTPDGLHRIDVPRANYDVEEGNVLRIRPQPNSGPIVVTVPVASTVQLKSAHGPIRVEGVHGEVDASSTNGAVDLINISGTIVADTTNGPIHATMQRVDPSKPMSFSSTNGEINVALPADVKANVKMRTVNGSVWSDFEIKLAGGTTVTRGGTMSGTINGGGVPASFTTINGRISIRKQ